MTTSQTGSSSARRALVVGGNRGIGLELCRQLKQRGRQVIAVCRTSSPELKALGIRVEADVDVTADAAAADLARRLEGAGLDELICSAGILREDSLADLDTDDVRAQFEVNALGPLRVVAALRGQVTSPGGKIALITSRMGSIADNSSGGEYGYRMSKAALNAAGVSMARDLRQAGIAVAILHPGYVRTDMTGGAGNVGPDESARMLIDRLDALTMTTSGTFWHANGQVLPW
ncbi:MAG TPA: SDR family oxidoreductase [Polyangia bacterium]|jgi:NAD(P)-dependent dehydrogenase (short-subunit alcohol dehydrogenase family)|nr:SDR family oxidoreductase [Polyangia bacterium]